MSETTPNFINERPVTNKYYCTMTTIHMLEECEQSYLKTYNRLQAHLDGLSEKYYNNGGCEIPPDIRDEIKEVNIEVDDIEKRLINIKTAIEVIGGTCIDKLEE